MSQILSGQWIGTAEQLEVSDATLRLRQDILVATLCDCVMFVEVSYTF